MIIGISLRFQPLRYFNIRISFSEVHDTERKYLHHLPKPACHENPSIFAVLLGDMSIYRCIPASICRYIYYDNLLVYFSSLLQRCCPVLGQKVVEPRALILQLPPNFSFHYTRLCPFLIE